MNDDSSDFKSIGEIADELIEKMKADQDEFFKRWKAEQRRADEIAKGGIMLEDNFSSLKIQLKGALTGLQALEDYMNEHGQFNVMPTDNWGICRTAAGKLLAIMKVLDTFDSEDSLQVDTLKQMIITACPPKEKTDEDK
jgi:hypothetical protein